MGVKALITAAGMSSRMNNFKPLMKIGDRYMAERVIDNLREAGAEEIVMVTGNRADELEAALSHTGVRFVRNQNYSTTQMFESVKIGLAALCREVSEDSFDRILFTPVDIPLTSPETIRRVLNTDAGIVMPQYNGRLGHPIAFDESLVRRILNFNGGFGLRGALEDTGEKIARLYVDDPGIVADADTPEDYEKILKFESIRKRIILIRHAEPAGYAGAKRYIGRTDLPLSEDGAKEASALGRWISENIKVDRVIASPLERAYKTGKIIAEKCSIENELEVDERLKEICVGEWEGVLVSEVKEKFLSEYEARGKDMYNREFPGGESFSQVGERFESVINEIVSRDSEKKETIVIASHSGAIGSYLARIGAIEEADVRNIPMPYVGMTTLTCDKNGIIEVTSIGVKPVEFLNDNEIEKLYNKYEVPGNIRAHMKAVSDYQEKLLDKLEEAGKYYNRDTLRKAALLHDIARLERRHAEVGARLICKEGYPEIADIVMEHHSPERMFCKPDGDGRNFDDITMGDILFYADKRVKETSIVSIEVRFAIDEKKHTNEKLIAKNNAQRERAMGIELALSKYIEV